MKKTLLFSVALGCAAVLAPQSMMAQDTPACGYIVLGEYDTLDDDEQASYDWFNRNYV